jgi:hypothetical protein
MRLRRLRGLPDSLALKVERLQVFPERYAEVVAAQSEFHRRLQEAELVTRVLARFLEAVAVDRPVPQQVL